ncbi:MAG: phosphorylase family protein [Acidimicrobiales bacterium]
MRLITTLALGVVLTAGSGAAAVVAATAGPTASAAACTPRLLVVSAFPAELGKIMKATALDSTEPIRSRNRKEFWTGTIGTRAVVLGLTGIGPVNAQTTTQDAFDTFGAGCIRGVVFSGVSGAGGGSRIGDVTVPDRWTSDDGAHWVAADPTMLATAHAVARSVTLENTSPLGDPACACIDPNTVRALPFPYQPKVLFGGDASTTDPFGGHAAPCLQHGGDLAGCEPCPAAMGTSPDPQRFATGMLGIADPSFFLGIIRPSPPSSHTYVSYDEETGATAAVAAQHGVGYIGFRSISDGTADPLMLPGFPSQFFVYKQLAADNAATMALAFIDAWT